MFSGILADLSELRVSEDLFFISRAFIRLSGRFSNIGNHFWRLDELLKLLRGTKRELSPSESKGLHQELAEIRARLLQESSLKPSKQ